MYCICILYSLWLRYERKTNLALSTLRSARKSSYQSWHWYIIRTQPNPSTCGPNPIQSTPYIHNFHSVQIMCNDVVKIYVEQTAHCLNSPSRSHTVAEPVVMSCMPQSHCTLKRSHARSGFMFGKLRLPKWYKTLKQEIIIIRPSYSWEQQVMQTMLCFGDVRKCSEYCHNIVWDIHAE